MTAENASSTNPDDLAEALNLLQEAQVSADLAQHAAKEAHNMPAETDAETAKVYAKLEVVGRLRQRAADKAEAACKILSRLAALRD